MAEIIEAIVKSNIGEFAKDAEKAAKATEDVGKGAKRAKGGVTQLGVGFKSLMKASGIVFLLNEAFTIFKEVLGKNQKAMDFMKTSTTAVSIAFNDFFKFLNNNIGTVVKYFKSIFDDPVGKMKEFGKVIEKNMIERFNSLVDTLGFFASALKNVFAGDFQAAMDDVKSAYKESVDIWTGVDNTVDKVVETTKKATTAIKDYTVSTWEQAEAVTETEKAANRAAVEFAKLNAQYLKDAEVQRQIRDDVSASFADRIKANEKLNKILEDQQELQREQVQKQIDAAQAQYDINASEENYIALQEAKVSMLELEETITGQLSEQKTNQVALEIELLEAQKATRAEGLSGMERELQDLKDAYDEKVKLAKQAGMDTTALDEKYAKDRKKIVRDNVNDQVSAYGNLAGALSGLFGDNKELAAASAIIDTYVAANRAMSEGGPYLGPVMAAAAIASGLANVQKIYATGPAGGGGGGVDASVPAVGMASGGFTLEGAGGAVDPVQAFVVTDDMTNSQDKLATIRRRATI